MTAPAIHSVKSRSLTEPPDVPAENDRYIVPPGARGPWFGLSTGIIVDFHLETAAWTSTTPQLGQLVTVDDEFGQTIVYQAVPPGGWIELPRANRRRLTADETLYVRAAGDDQSGDGSSGNPVNTWDRAIEIAAELDLNRFIVTVDGRETRTTDTVRLKKLYNGTGRLIGLGATTIINATDYIVGRWNAIEAIGIDGEGVGSWYIDGVKLNGKNADIEVMWDSYIQLGPDVTFGGDDFNVTHIFAWYGARVEAYEGYKINSTTALVHAWALFGAAIHIEGTVALTGTPAWGDAFARADGESVVDYQVATFTGSATGLRWDVGDGGRIIKSSFETLPGDSDGVEFTGGVYNDGTTAFIGGPLGGLLFEEAAAFNAIEARLQANAGRFKLTPESAAVSSLNHEADAGISVLDLAAKPLDGTGIARIRLHRVVNTTGLVDLVVHKGNNTSAIGASFSGSGGSDSYVANQGGNFGVGLSSPATLLDVAGAIGISGTTVIDAARHLAMRSYTIATLPTTTGNVAKIIWCSDLGGNAGPLVAFGSFWRRLDAAREILATDAAFTRTVLTSAEDLRHTGTLTANRAYTLSTTNAYEGARFRITRTGGGAFSLTNALKNLATNQWAEFIFDGTNWYLAAFGSL